LGQQSVPAGLGFCLLVVRLGFYMFICCSLCALFLLMKILHFIAYRSLLQFFFSLYCFLLLIVWFMTPKDCNILCYLCNILCYLVFLSCIHSLLIVNCRFQFNFFHFWPVFTAVCFIMLGFSCHVFIVFSVVCEFC